MGKYVTLRFYTNPKNYEKDAELAKQALLKLKEDGMESGEVKTKGNLTIKIEETQSGMM